MRAMADYFLNALVTLFVTIDPIGLAPVFMALTTGMAVARRREIAVRAAVTAAIILIAFALVGEPLLGFLGISQSAFRIAGGLLLFVIAFEMVFERRDDRKSATAERASETEGSAHDLAIFPLAIPLTSGPGAISAVILLSSGAQSTVALIGLLVIVVLMVAACLAVFLLAPQIERLLGATGRVVVSRLLGVLLAALSVQFVADGVMAIARS
jgi:multiple antibiotic resistance protein